MAHGRHVGKYWKCYNTPTDGDETWVVASNQHLYRKAVTLVLVVSANRTVNVLVLRGVDIKTSTILMKRGGFVTVVQKNKIW